MKAITIDNALIRAPSFIFLCTNKSQFDLLMSEEGCDKREWLPNDHSDAATHFLTNCDSENICVVCIKVRENITGVQIASLLVHEAVHIFQRYCEYVGEIDPSTEFQAYAIQALSQELMQAYHDSTKG